MRRRYAGFAAIGLVVVLATASYASAAHLDLRGASLTTTSAGHPCPGTLAATTPTTPTPTTAVSTVTVTAPAACAGRTLHIAVNSGGTVVEGTAQAPASGSVIVHLDGSYVPTASTTVAATVSSWGLPTTWSYVPPEPPASGPIVPGNPQTVITGITWTVQNNNQACAAVSVTTNTASTSWWRVYLNVNEAPFYGTTTGFQLGGQVHFVAPTATDPADVLVIQGSNNGWGNLAAGTVRTFTVCHYGLPNPPDVPSAYTVTYSQGEWTDTQACVRATITGNGSSQFYFGWRAQIDMTPAFQRIQAAGRTVDALQPEAGSWGNIVSFSPTLSPSSTSYQLSNLWQGVVRASESRTVGICARSW